MLRLEQLEPAARNSWQLLVDIVTGAALLAVWSCIMLNFEFRFTTTACLCRVGCVVVYLRAFVDAVTNVYYKFQQPSGTHQLIRLLINTTIVFSVIFAMEFCRGLLYYYRYYQ